MFVHNNGSIAAALVSAGLHGLPMDFNLDDGIVQKYMDEFAIAHPAFDKVMHQTLAIVKAAEGYAATLKHMEEELAKQKEEPKAEEPSLEAKAKADAEAAEKLKAEEEAKAKADADKADSGDQQGS